MSTIYQNKGAVVTAETARDVTITNYYGLESTPKVKKQKVLFGYYESWFEYLDGIEKYSLEDIDVKKLTHVAYAYIKLNDDGSLNLGDIENYTNSQRFQQFIHLKHKNPHLKLLISLGGWMENANIFEEVFGDDVKLQKLNEDLVDLITKFKFDGLDLVWIYPEARHKALFTKFFATLRSFNTDLFGASFILSAAISPDTNVGDIYELKELEKYLDFFNILAYGFLSGQHRTEHNASLQRIKLAMREWIRKEVDFKKILLGVELGGKQFQLTDPANNKLNSECIGQGTIIKSLKISELLASDNWTTVKGPKGDFAYSFCNNQWITHENEETVQSKTRYACDNQMAGIALMALNYEGNMESPLLDAIFEEINKSAVPDVL